MASTDAEIPSAVFPEPDGKPLISRNRGTTMQENQWPRIAVLGAGAVGCYFGGMLARAGAPVTLIGRPQHVEAINRGGLFLDTINFQQKVAVSATTEVSAVHD